MNAQKIMIIALVVLVMVFVITIGLGGSHSSGASDRSDPVEFLKGLRSHRFLELGDKASSNCGPTGAHALTFSGKCTLTLEKRGFAGTPTRVVLHPNGAGLVIAVDPRRGPKQDATVDPGDCFETSIDNKGGEVTLERVGPGQITVDIFNHGCPEKPK